MNDIQRRTLEEAYFLLETKKTVREIAKIFHISKSTVHKDLHERLKKIDKDLFQKVNDIFIYHTNIRHLRGGMSTKKKYLNSCK